MNDEMEFQKSRQDDFELALTQALRRVDAPVGFAEKVAAAARVSEAGQRAPKRARLFAMPMPRPKVWLSGAMAAALVASVFVAQDLHQRRERAMADQQFALSMQIEARAMEHTRQQLARAGLSLE